MYCIFCEKESTFENYGVPERSHVKCGRCGSLERQRLMWTWLTRLEMALLTNANVLHISAEPYFREAFSKVARQYSSPRWDLRRLPAADHTFDVILHTHIVQSIFEDCDAFREQARILKSGGILYFTVPLGPPAGLNTQFAPPKDGKGFRKSYTISELTIKMQRCGFSEVTVIDAGKQLNPDEVAASRLGDHRIVRAVANYGTKHRRDFTTDWVTWKTQDWARVLAPLIGRADVRGLEIGSFEGRSACWFLDYIVTGANAVLHCVDPWKSPVIAGSRAHEIERRFRSNVRSLSDRVEIHKSSSLDCLLTLIQSYGRNTFDFVYVDGCHEAAAVQEDLVLSWFLLKQGGVLIGQRQVTSGVV